MDTNKRELIVSRFSETDDPILIDSSTFFDGNDDAGSIGCNLLEHPGVPEFKRIFEELLNRSDVSKIIMQIAELDPGEDSWPFSDTAYIYGDIPTEELKTILAPLEPDEVGPPEEFNVPEEVSSLHSENLQVVWWD